MNVIIIGITPISEVLAQYMVEEGHDIHVVDPNSEAIAQLLTKVDVRALQGDVRDPEILREAHIHSADLVMAVTNSDTSNIVTALGLHSLAPKAKAAIWVRDEQFTGNNHLWNGSQLDKTMVLTPERNALNLVMDLLEIPLSFEVTSFLDGKIHIAGFRLQDDSPLIGKRLKDVAKSRENRTLIAAVERGQETHVPDGNFVFEINDRLYIPLLAGQELSSAFTFMGLEQSHLRMRKSHHLIAGGGRMGLQLALKLENEGFRPTLIEKDRARGQLLVERLSKTRVLLGDITDPSLMQEMIHSDTTFIGLTGNQELNFMSSVLARRFGAGRSITMFDNEGYISLSAFMGIDAAVHPNLTAIGQVLGLLRPYDVREAHLMLGGKLEAVLVRLEHDSPLVGKALHEAGMPKGVIVAALLRKNRLLLPDGSTHLLPDDQILIVTHRQSKHKHKLNQLIKPGH
ncbi:Trk system potassium uptake protein TrkA [Candidatus Magnetaquicoccaceae bacterium FCR-1]|uniref:Trk system potassium uptake protein TrkA n=1 Tax=Candidatus Magnetaquiglobus chichijimensis TaxID=3141448 RepID=A0ABQ0C9C0_9PROT